MCFRHVKILLRMICADCSEFYGECKWNQALVQCFYLISKKKWVMNIQEFCPISLINSAHKVVVEIFQSKLMNIFRKPSDSLIAFIQ